MQHCVSRRSRPCERPGQAAGHHRVPRFGCRAGQGQRGRPAEPHGQLECFARQALIRLSILHAVLSLSLHVVLIETTASCDVSCLHQGTLPLTGCTFAVKTMVSCSQQGDLPLTSCTFAQEPLQASWCSWSPHQKAWSTGSSSSELWSTSSARTHSTAGQACLPLGLTSLPLRHRITSTTGAPAQRLPGQQCEGGSQQAGRQIPSAAEAFNSGLGLVSSQEELLW